LGRLEGCTVMRRVPHGMTTRPISSRPGNGYGRIQRPGPDPYWAQRLLSAERRSGERRADPSRLSGSGRRADDARQPSEQHGSGEQYRG
jgi:hypothetical protein